MNFATTKDLLKKTYSEVSDDKVPRLAAALAYYTSFSIAPLLIIVIAIVALVLGHKGATDAIAGQIRDFVGNEGAQAIQSMLKSANKPGQGIISAIIGLITLFIGATGVFGQLQDALNTVWNVPPQETPSGFWAMIKSRFLSFTMVIGTGFLLLVSLVASAAISAVSKAMGSMLPFSEAMAQGVTFLISLAMTAALFAMILKYLPNRTIQWKHVWIGALVTALLFTLGKWALGLYLGHSAIASSYGAAGSFVVVLLWVYYSSMLVLVGAEFTQVYHEWETHQPPKEAREAHFEHFTRSGYAKSPPLR
jgi:membrane protein